MRNVVPFKSPGIFVRVGIDWTRAATTERERALREAYLTYESSCGPEGLVALLLLATVSRRQGAVAEDLQGAADHAEILLVFKMRPHQDEALKRVQTYLTESNPLWT